MTVNRHDASTAADGGDSTPPFSPVAAMNFVNSALSKAGVGLLGASQSIKANLAKQTTTVTEAYYKKSGFDFTNFVGTQLKTMPERWAVVRCRNY